MVEKSCMTTFPRTAEIRRIIVWFDTQLDVVDVTMKRSLSRLQSVYEYVEPFINIDQCVDFITNLDDNNESTIVIDDSSSSDGHILALIQSLHSVKAIYILILSKEQ